MKEVLPWISPIVVILGFVAQGYFGSFRLGRAVEQIRSAMKEYIDNERDKVLGKIEELERKFDVEQRTQDHNFGEVGAAMRQYIADVEKFGLKNYVQKEDFRDAIDKIEETIRSGHADLKADLKELQKIVAQRN